MSIISQNIQNRMWALNLTQEQLAKMVGYAGRASINKIVNGDQDPSLDKIEAFAKALHTTPAILCGWDDVEVIDNGKRGYNLETLAKRLRRNEFDVDVFSDKKEAVEYLVKRCEGKSVGLGDFVCTELNLYEELKETNISGLYATDIRKNKENGKNAVTADVYILAANAISYETGEMVNISHRGDRIAGSLYYSDEIIFLLGKNKISRNLEEAIFRAKNVIVQKACKKYGLRPPCVETGKCENCNSPDKFCRVTCIYSKKPIMTNMTVILIDEEVGY